MMALETRQAERSASEPPPGKVRCFISKQVVDVSETVEFVFNGVRVRIHRKYVPASSDPAPVP
jgi:hypothetical protein